MNTNAIALEMGGKKRSMLFDFGTFDHLEAITGKEPLEFGFDTNNHKSLRDGAEVLIYAGLLTACDDKGEIADFSREDVRGWVKRLSVGQIIAVINTWGNSKKVEAAGEGGKDTRE